LPFSLALREELLQSVPRQRLIESDVRCLGSVRLGFASTLSSAVGQVPRSA
jgi:hypothetical protein